MSVYTNNYYDNRTLESKTNRHDDGRTWISESGRGEGCRTCQSQINVRHVLAENGYVTLCADCRAVYTDGGRR